MAFVLRPRVVERDCTTHLSQIEILAAESPRTTNRDGMTRIGFAYNQKPESPVGLVSAASSSRASDEEPPSTQRRLRGVGLRGNDRRRRLRALRAMAT